MSSITAIHTETSERNPIPNQQNLFLHGNEKAIAAKLEQDHNATVRTSPSGFYNCHGLTFSSRRTCIDDPSSLNMILKDDSYIQVPNKDVLPGDIVLYFENGLITHSGIVVEVPNIVPLTCKVVSKWGTNGEFIHWVNKSPYGHEFRYYRVERQKQNQHLAKILLG
jgi:hypothetical protein